MRQEESRAARMLRILRVPAGLAVAGVLTAAYIGYTEHSQVSALLTALSDTVARAENEKRYCEGAVGGASAFQVAETALLARHTSVDQKLPDIRARLDVLRRTCCEERTSRIQYDIEKLNKAPPEGVPRSVLLRQVGGVKDLGDQQEPVASTCGLSDKLKLIAAAAEIESGFEAQYDEPLRTAFQSAAQLASNAGPFGGQLFPEARLLALNAACVEHGTKWADQAYSTKHWDNAARGYQSVIECIAAAPGHFDKSLGERLAHRAKVAATRAIDETHDERQRLEKARVVEDSRKQSRLRRVRKQVADCFEDCVQETHDIDACSYDCMRDVPADVAAMWANGL